MKNKKENSSSVVKITALGVGLAGLAASAYFFLGPKGKKNQKHIKSWAIKMKADIIEKLEKTRDVSEPVYNKIIDTIADKYKKSLKVNHEEIAELASDLKKHWKIITNSKKGLKKKSD